MPININHPDIISSSSHKAKDFAMKCVSNSTINSKDQSLSNFTFHGEYIL